MDANELRDQVAYGQRIEKLYSQFAEQFIRDIEKKCFDRFKAASHNDNEELTSIKLLQVGISALEKEMLNIIQSGEFAKEQLATEAMENK